MTRRRPMSPFAGCPGRGRPIAQPAALLLAASAALSLTACGSAAGHGGPAARPAAAPAACTQVSAALADGPDPATDPVGYAEAQVRPLRAISTADPDLRTALGDLAAAYSRVYRSNGTSGTAATAVKAATRTIRTICPGVAS